MPHIDDIIDSYDDSETAGQQKTRILKWFRQRPGRRFDRMELASALSEDLEIGQRQLGSYLDELVADGVLTVHGNQRKAYQLAPDVLPPATVQIREALRYLVGVFDIDRWGVAGVMAMTTTIWTVLTVPFLLLWSLLLLIPGYDHVGPIAQSELLVTALAMSFWLGVFVLVTAVLYRVHRSRYH